MLPPIWVGSWGSWQPPIPYPRRLGGVERLPWMGAVTASRTGGARSTGTKFYSYCTAESRDSALGSKERFCSARCQVRVGLLALSTKKAVTHTKVRQLGKLVSPKTTYTSAHRRAIPTSLLQYHLVPYSSNNVILHLPRVLDPSYITPSYISQKRPLYPLTIHIPRPQQTD